MTVTTQVGIFHSSYYVHANSIILHRNSRLVIIFIVSWTYKCQANVDLYVTKTYICCGETFVRHELLTYSITLQNRERCLLSQANKQNPPSSEKCHQE